MKKSILVVGFACLSMIVVAQSTSDKKTAPASTAAKRGISSPTGASADRTTSPRDLATGQASGKRVETTHTVSSPRDTVSGQSTGRRVAAGDVNGDGATAQPASVKEVSTGKATGKMASDDWQAPAAKGSAAGTGAASGNAQQQRMHKPLAITK